MAAATRQAESGLCREAVPILKRTYSTEADKELKRRGGLAGLKCSLGMDDRDSAAEFMRWLHRDFGSDPEVLYVLVHGYSDLSTRVAQELAQKAPKSIPARELHAEAMEIQGNWDGAEKEYQTILQENASVQGIHFRLGRLYLSRPGINADAVAKAKMEFEEELKIDPNNAGAEYILGELARQSSEWPDAIVHFERATKLDPNFGDAFLGLGFAYLSSKEYGKAISPLQSAVRLQPGNPAAHYNLAMAYSRDGRKQEADKEFAIHRQMTSGKSQQSGGRPSQN